MKPPRPANVEAALDAEEEDPLLDRRGRVEDVDQMRQLASSLRMPPIRPASISPPNRLPFTGHADRGDVDDRELAVEQLADIDLDALDRAGEFAARRMPLMPVTLADSVSTKSDGSLLDVGPVDADRVDPDRQPGRPLEAVAGRAADARGRRRSPAW